MAIDPESYLVSFGVIILIAFLGYLLFERTKVPDVILLVGLGILLGPLPAALPEPARFSPILDPAVFGPLMPLVAAVAIIIILFDGGLKLNMKDLFVGVWPATMLGLLAFVATALLVAGLLKTLGIVSDIWVALTLGAVLGGTSSVLAVPWADRMRIEARTRTIIGLESAVADVLVIVGTISLAIALHAAEIQATRIAVGVVQRFAVGLALGLGAGFVWTSLMRRFTQRSYEYMVTIALLFIVYALTEFLGGLGPIAVLAFGIVLGNGRRLNRLEGEDLDQAIAARKRRYELSPVFHVDLVNLHSEIVFFVRAFFFVAIGVVLDLALLSSPRFLLASALILVAIVVARAWAVAIVFWRSKLPMRDKDAMFVLMPRGLAAAALAGVPFATYAIDGSAQFVTYAVMLILLTNAATALGVWVVESERFATWFMALMERRRVVRDLKGEEKSTEKATKDVRRLQRRQQEKEGRAALRAERAEEKRQAKIAARENRLKEVERRKAARMGKKEETEESESKQGPWGG